MLKREMQKLRLLVSYADLNQGHEGKIYQASNWLFVGATGTEASIVLNGKITHRRTINSKYGTSTIEWLQRHVDPRAGRVEGKPKYKYLLPLMTKLQTASNNYRRVIQTNAPQAKRTLRLESIQERAV
jgi:hypothetical protein